MIGERLAESRKRRGLLQVDLAVALGDRYDQTMISAVERGRSSLLSDGLANAARALQVSTDYLLGLTDDPTPSAQLESRLASAEAELDAYRHELQGSPVAYVTGRDEVSTSRARETDPAETVLVAVRKGVLAAGGGGAFVDSEGVTGYVGFRRDWLRSHSINPEEASIIEVTGDSMEPTLPAGCSVLVDQQRRTRRKGRIYVLQTEDGLIVKRAGREKTGWELVSDNPYWPAVSWPPTAGVVGEVRWVARTF